MLEVVMRMSKELKRLVSRLLFAEEKDINRVVWACDSCSHRCMVMWDNDAYFGLAGECLIFPNDYLDKTRGVRPDWNRVV
jgi:hypothetical protein